MLTTAPPSHTRCAAISLGGGVQSTVMALMGAEGAFGPPPDVAIFADTGWEPKAVYEHLDWLETQLPFPVYRVQHRNLKEDTERGVDQDGKPGVAIPVFTRQVGGKGGNDAATLHIPLQSLPNPSQTP